MNRLLLFDLDGTLTNPYTGIANCIRYAFACLGRTSPDDDALKRWIGPPLKQSFAAILDGDDGLAEQALSHYRERFAEVGLFENELIEGIDKVLKRQVAAGHRCVVATAKPTVYASRIVEHFGLHQYCSITYGSELDGTRTDKAELIGDIIAAESTAANQMTMVGDREHDILGARHHSVRSVGVLWGFGNETELRQAGADHVVANPEQLAAVLN